MNKRVGIAVSFSFLLIYSGIILPQAVQTDTAFGQSGIVNYVFNVNNYDCILTSSAIRENGKIIVTGNYNNGSVLRPLVASYNPDGSQDNSFGTNGIITPQIASGGSFNSSAIQSDGKILTAGYSIINSGTVSAIARYNQTGSPDSTFGSAGLVTTSIGANSKFVSISLQKDGKIIAAGFSLVASKYEIELARYDPDGTPDKTFGSDGIVTARLDSSGSSFFASSICIQKDGKIIITGTLENTSFQLLNFLARFNNNGSLDNTYGTNGFTVVDFNITSSAIQSNDKIVIAGYDAGGNKNIAVARYDPSGFPDNKFGTGGIVTKSPGPSVNVAQSVALQNDGKIVSAGYFFSGKKYNFVVLRVDSSGIPDNTFGINGIDSTATGTSGCLAYSVSIQNDGKILTAGISMNAGHANLVLIRYNINGDPDYSFGNYGIAVTQFGKSNDAANSLSVQTDGKIVIAGYSNNSASNYFTLLRFNTNGQADNTFGANGVAVAGIGKSDDEANAVAVQSDGKIIAAGYSYNGKNKVFAIVRLNQNGFADNTFGTNGIVTTPVGSYDAQVTSATVQEDQKIVAAGYYLNGNFYNFAVARYKTDGNQDSTFGSDGVVTTQVGAAHNFAQALAVQKDGKIVVAGSSMNGSNYDFALVRYNTDGSPDQTFGSKGIVTTRIAVSADAYSVLIQSDGKLVLTGYAWNGSHYVFAIARYNSDGSPDNSFGTNGFATTQSGAENDFAYSAALQKNGKIVAAGYSEQGSINAFACARFNADGTTDNAFGNDGILITRPGTSNGFARAVAMQDDGKIVAAGYSSNPDESNYKIFTLIRYNSGLTTGISNESKSSTPVSFSVRQNYPNPFNPQTTIKYSIPERSFVNLKIYDILGREVASLLNSNLEAGEYASVFNAQSLASGVYIYSIHSKGLVSNKDITLSKKMILLK